MKDYYRILQVDPAAEPEVIQAARRRLARKYHPDVNPSPDATLSMQELNEAFEVLNDPMKRAEYDRERQQQLSRDIQQRRREAATRPRKRPPPPEEPPLWSSPPRRKERTATPQARKRPGPATRKERQPTPRWVLIGVAILVLLSVATCATLAIGFVSSLSATRESPFLTRLAATLAAEATPAASRSPAPPMPTGAFPTPMLLRTVGQSLLFAGPSTTFSVIAVLEPDTPIMPVEQTPDGVWYHVTVPGSEVEGWMYAALLSGVEGLAPLPTADWPTPSPVPLTGSTQALPSNVPAPTTQTATPLPSAPPVGSSLGDTWMRPSDEMAMVYVPEGKVEMGDTGGGTVTMVLDGFWIDRTELTNSQYRRCVNAGACWTPTTCDWGSPTYGLASHADHPVVCVSWSHAQAYCEWVGGRLPTEMEWEYAARGPEGRVFPWGNEFDGMRLNYCDTNCQTSEADETADDGYARTAPVGSYARSASWCGALDLAGNVSEWTVGCSLNHPSLVLWGMRGGSWGSSPDLVRSNYAGSCSTYLRDHHVGFRCARSSP